MLPRLCLTLFLVPSLAFASPTRAALRKAFEVASPSVLEVVGPRRSGAGVVVSADGHVVTSVDYVSLEEAQVRLSDKTLSAKVVAADGRLKVAVVKLAPEDAPYRATAVRLSETARAGELLVAVTRKKGNSPAPTVTQVTRAADEKTPFIEAAHLFPPGSPLFDGKGRLVAVAVGRRGKRTHALPVTAIKTLLEAAARLPSAKARP
ncbi:MAG: S1 family peptidase [Myxococcota bacterium]